MTEKKFRNLEIGKTFMIGYRKFKVVEASKEYSFCKNCFFSLDDFRYDCLGLDMQEKGFLPSCSNCERTDNKNVIFKEVK